VQLPRYMLGAGLQSPRHDDPATIRRLAFRSRTLAFCGFAERDLLYRLKSQSRSPHLPTDSRARAESGLRARP
jgi:hypothetical protein